MRTLHEVRALDGSLSIERTTTAESDLPMLLLLWLRRRTGVTAASYVALIRTGPTRAAVSLCGLGRIWGWGGQRL